MQDDYIDPSTMAGKCGGIIMMNGDFYADEFLSLVSGAGRERFEAYQIANMERQMTIWKASLPEEDKHKLVFYQDGNMLLVENDEADD